jgi:NADPH:quinone reductase-like Zn-dependent oxidoreductase
MANETVKVVRFHKVGGPEVLQLEEVPLAEPGKGEVRLRVKAIGLNRAESMFRSGQYVEDPILPGKLGYEAAGVVEAIGPKVDESWMGKTVSVMPSFSMNKYGTYGRAVIVPVSSLALYPERFSFEEGTSFWMAYLTAYGPLVEYEKIGKRDFVVITAASSSVGIAAIEIAKRQGAVSIATTRTSQKKEELLAAGADHVIATQEENYVVRVKEITKGNGARVTFDPIAGKLVETLVQAAARGGVLYEYGLLSGEATPFPLIPVLMKGLSMRGFNVINEVSSRPRVLKKASKYILEGLKAGQFKPRIAKTFPLEEIVEAHRYLESNQQIGKVVVTA